MDILEILRLGVGLFTLASCFTSRRSLCTFGLDGIFSAAGSIAAAKIGADAAKDATRQQIKALERQRDFIFKELEPGKLSSQALAQDVARSKEQRALQSILDPALLRARYAAEAGIESGLAGLTTGAGDQLAGVATQEALAAGGNFDELKQRLIDTALDELDAGATLPQDVQAELVKAGLERGAGAVGGAAGAGGLAGAETRRLIGQEGIKLQADRQARAAALGAAAQDLEARRASILGSLFPSLKANQLANLDANKAAIALSQGTLPEAGLTGESLTNLWLSRVGATGNIMGKIGEAAAAGGLAQAGFLNAGILGATGAIANAGIPSSFANALVDRYRDAGPTVRLV